MGGVLGKGTTGGSLVTFATSEAKARIPSRHQAATHRLVHLAWYVGAGALRPLRAPTRFVLLATPRSGSELLVELLNGQDAVVCHGEVFRDPPRWPLRWLDAQAAVAGLGGARAYGCKILGHDLSWHPGIYGGPAFMEALAERGWRFIELQRQDLLLQAVSMLEGVQRQLHVREIDLRDARPVTIDPVELISLMFNLEQEATFISDVLSSVSHLTLSYEADLRQPELQRRAVSRISRHLGVPMTDVAPRLRRHGSTLSLEERVLNHDEVVAAVAGTRFGCLLEPGRAEPASS